MAAVAYAAGPRYGAPAPQPAAAAQPAGVDSAAAPAPAPLPHAGVPDVVEDVRKDTVGNTVVRRYQRGRLLGKVRAQGW